MHAALGDTLGGPRNALTVTRLALAGLVVTSHTWPVGGFGPDPHLGGLGLGTFALFGFFAISGYLLAGSRTRLSLWQFLLRRSLRIYPGLWLALCVTAFVIAPLGAIAGAGPFDVGSAAHFVLNNATGHLAQPGIADQLANVPAAGKWNIPIWTLEYELLCYVLVALVFSVPVLRRHPTMTSIAALCAASALNICFAQELIAGHQRLSILSALFAFFAAGMLLWSLRNSLRPEPMLLAGAALIVVAAAMTGFTYVISPLPIALLVLGGAATCPIGRGIATDLSFGVYVYGWPLQQLAQVLDIDALGPWAFTVSALMGSLLLAYGSWTLVERPAIEWGRRRRRLSRSSVAKAVGKVSMGDRRTASNPGQAQSTRPA